ncbi:DUF4422 domain-containing protein [Domibacillus robiginosus]|uniref:DUF4422 domain-containing protein n=1 Tax=Domibacillus robiginosus TaxID=1071054 RepID=UPI00067B1ECC|nr:DUF4422 domain-containing protein [Domibacillus robiginosus]
MKEDIKILVATHKEYQMPDEDMYFPLHVGREGKKDLGYQGDNTNDNISLKNSTYCELTGLYWAWKNINSKYIGLSHYRRYFSNEGGLTANINHTKQGEKLDNILSEKNARDLLKHYNIILPKKRNYYIETVWSHYKNAHHIKDLEETKRIISEKHPSYINSFERVMKRRKLHLYNMFIMKKEDFDKYCEWLFDILFELEKKVDISGYDAYQKRIFGFIGERLFNVWLEENQLKYKELNVFNVEKVNQVKKVVNFVSRKISGKNR